MDKVISFVIPCYNSAAYMSNCIESLLPCGDDIEILIVDDGSTKDNTYEIALSWQEKYPTIIRACHKENGGHGSVLNYGIAHATGMYYKVVDSDDWLDAESMKDIMAYLRTQMNAENPTDLIIAKYVYEKVCINKRKSVGYRNALPKNREFTWAETKPFAVSQYLLMHSLIYRRQVLLDSGIVVPENCFYVDSVLAAVPLPYAKKLYYFDEDMYHYYIGRSDQSVNEQVMLGRREQQARVARTLIDACEDSLVNGRFEDKRLRNYSINFVSIIMCITSVFQRMPKTEEDDEILANLWLYLKNLDPELYRKTRHHIANVFTNIPGEAGRKIGIACYRLADKVMGFN